VRITVHIPDSLENDIKKASKNEGKSVSSLIAEATEYYLKEKKKKEIGKRVLEIAGKVKVATDTLEELHSERKREKNDRA
jgi:antitoxin VapB